MPFCAQKFRWVAVLLLFPATFSAEQRAVTVKTPVSKTSSVKQRWTRAEMEQFLRTARILNTRPLGIGITKPLRATLSDGRRKHDAHIQAVDIFKKKHTSDQGTEYNFRDSYKFNIAAYRLDKILGLNMIPVCVDRTFEERDAAFSWWIENVMGSELDRIQKKLEPPDVDFWNEQNYVVRVFDQLIYNTDRNRGNLLITKEWVVWMIDHTRAFRVQNTLMDAKKLVKCDRKLLAGLRKLNEEILTRELSPWIGAEEISALLARRDLIVKTFDDAIARKGEHAVLYDIRKRERL